MARNKAKDPNHLSFGRLMAWKSSDISAGWVNVIMLNYLSLYASVNSFHMLTVVNTESQETWKWTERIGQHPLI